jgi:hypothetical protein
MGFIIYTHLKLINTINSIHNGLNKLSYISTGPPFTDLKTISNLTLWLDASASSITKDTNNYVKWADKSVKGNDMAQTACKSGSEIVFKSTNMFNKPAVYIPQQGVPPLRNANIQCASFPVTFFMVFGADANNGYTGVDLHTSFLAANYINDSGQYTGDDTPHNQVQISMLNYNFYVGATAGATGDYNFDVSSSKLNLVMVQMDGTADTASTMVVNYNGTNKRTKNDYNHTYTTQHKGMIIFAGQQPLYMCECAYYNSSLTTTEIKKVEGYLAWKWGLNTSLPTTHPYYSRNPTI